MPTPPRAKKIDHRRVHHGDEFIDPYEWLRDKDNPEVIAHLEAENTYAEAMTQHQESLRTQIFEEIKSRTKQTDMSIPLRSGPWWYYSRITEGEQYGRTCRIAAGDSWTPPDLSPETEIPGEQVLLDANREAEGHEFFSLGGLNVSLEHTHLAYGVDVQGDERYTIRVKDLATNELLDDVIEGATGSVAWAKGSTHFFYTVYDESWRPFQVWRHELGGSSVLVYEEPDERFFLGVGVSDDDRFLMIGASSKTTSEYRILDAADPTGEFTVVWERQDDVEYTVDYARYKGQECFLVTHNRTAKNFQVDVVDLDTFAVQETLVAGHDTERIDGVAPFARHIVLSIRRNALPHLDLLTLDGSGVVARESIDVGEELFSTFLGGNAEFDPPVLRMGYTSFISPTTIFNYDLATGERTVLKRQEVLGGYDPGDYIQKREWAQAEDGTMIPISIVAHRNTKLDGTAPGHLYGYGSYEISLNPGLSIARISLLERGFVYAIAHVRGGGELGRQWYETGRREHKRNTFTDFVAVARFLAEQNYVDPKKLIAEGGSAGGLLLGAALNIDPDAFGGMVVAVPFVDPLTTILKPELPLTVIEWDEWGNPLADEAAYRYIQSYAPYENITDANYPPILVTTSLNDTRVLYVEPAKWVQVLREHSTNPVLLKTELHAGHGGVSGRYRAWEERAFELAWMIDLVS